MTKDKLHKVLPLAAAAFSTIVTAGGLLSPVAAQSPLDPVPFAGGQVPDDLKTMVIGTRFIRASGGDVSPGRQFNEFRIPLSDFNKTDHCVDQGSLEVAEEYFRTLGRMLEKTGYYYQLPDQDTGRLISKCESQNGAPPKALANKGTKILAYGRVVPTTAAPALEETLR
ncbi:MAG: hypothetical protein RIC14_08605 [Filomicrobium sp.]